MKRQADTAQFFYQNGKLITIKQAAQQHAIFRTGEAPLAESDIKLAGGPALLAIDQSGSVLGRSCNGEREPLVYTAYGHDAANASARAILRFNGQHPTPYGHYVLGNGYRTYDPALMRFYAPDGLSPFAEGGLNSYMYCNGDPVGKVDPSGHVPVFLKPFRSFYKGIKNKFFGRTPKSQRIPVEQETSRKNSPAETARKQTEPSTNPYIQQIARSERQGLLQLQQSDLRDFNTYDLSTVPAKLFSERLENFNKRKQRIQDLTTKHRLEPAPQFTSAPPNQDVWPSQTARDIRHE
ncbi:MULTISPECIES: RHS repeat-associated core domain-containing protein [Pseudomonas]|uniref:RHS repeat-associated core domain-containing protein n=1 Tax=Pseudomonas TaxID=286 RepID=UPI001574DF52|nr:MULTISPECIES: RHS repeat-associated core domain-containing protein [Pseudomonas]MBG6125830.1 RHS repeat-associated protein [Pseudomonas sp. M2]NSX20950.1 RHS repeat-associated core domain-containing protein [Pseudomonas putida]HDS1748708.1 RHS repeat-associated core domain-containing protein [Pseudomonas putida]